MSSKSLLTFNDFFEVVLSLPLFLFKIGMALLCYLDHCLHLDPYFFKFLHFSLVLISCCSLELFLCYPVFCTEAYILLIVLYRFYILFIRLFFWPLMAQWLIGLIGINHNLILHNIIGVNRSLLIVQIEALRHWPFVVANVIHLFILANIEGTLLLASYCLLWFAWCSADICGTLTC